MDFYQYKSFINSIIHKEYLMSTYFKKLFYFTFYFIKLHNSTKFIHFIFVEKVNDFSFPLTKNYFNQKYTLKVQKNRRRY